MFGVTVRADQQQMNRVGLKCLGVNGGYECLSATLNMDAAVEPFNVTSLIFLIAIFVAFQPIVM